MVIAARSPSISPRAVLLKGRLQTSPVLLDSGPQHVGAPPSSISYWKDFVTFSRKRLCSVLLEPVIVIAFLTPVQASECDASCPECGQREITAPSASRDGRKSLEQRAYCTCIKLIERCRARALGRTISPRVLQ